MATVPVYCINLPASRERRARMERRLAHHGLLETTRFVDAASPATAEPTSDDLCRACTASHLRAMRAMLDDPAAADGAIVCEDDALLHDEFGERLSAVLAGLPEAAPLCMLGYLVDRWTLRWAEGDGGREVLCELDPDVMWGSHMYWLSPAYARRALERYGDLEIEDLTSVPEVLLHESGGYASYPSLAIQDAIDSDIHPQLGHLHFQGQDYWPYADYAACERGEDLSPLARRSLDAGETIGLCMIVRDEAAVIERCLASALPLIDAWTICDTGSTDSTPELVEAKLAGVPGELHRRPWRDFGHNRSELMELAEGSADYLLLIDADMTLRRTGPLPPLTADAYLLRHAGGLDYSIPRLVRGDRRWSYVGATHEYLTTEVDHGREPLETLLVEHHADGASRSHKLARDQALLERELERDPGNDRATFYLAQTVRDRGDVRRAIDLYGRRVALGGWDEEVFYAAYQRGVLTAQLNPDEGVRRLLEAADLRPARAEPLCELARVCRNEGHHRAAYRFAKRGLEVPPPGDILFVHRSVYEWELDFELSIAAYWVGEVAEALEVTDRLLAEGRLPSEFEAAARRNREFCLDALPHGAGTSGPGAPAPLESLVGRLDVAEIQLEIEPDWPRFNPSIAAAGDGFRLLVRSANYRLVEGRYEMFDDGVIRTLNYLARLDDSLGLTSVEPLADESSGPARHPSRVLGYEDCRLFEAGGRWLALATVRDRNPDETCEQALLRLDENRIESVAVLEGPEPGRHEKNWMPFVLDGEPHVVYTLGPTVVLRCDPDTGALEEVARSDAPPEADELRGGSQGIRVEGGFLFVAHEVIWEAGRRRYVHRFALLGDDLRLAAISPRFTFTGRPIELCAGMARRGDELLLSFGVGDVAAGLARCREGDVLALLEPADTPEREAALREELREALASVDGWLDDDEAWALHEVVRRHPSHRPSGPTVVEIGSWQGRSSIVIGRALRARRSGVVYAVDPHCGTALHESTGVADTYEAYLANVRAAGVAEHVRDIRARSTVARSRFEAGSVDVLFIDGAHEYDDVVRDVEDWTTALADVATAAFHDARDYESVSRALREHVLRPGSPFSNPRMVENTLFTDFRR